MKKIVLMTLLIISLVAPRAVYADEPYNPWDSCSANFVKYSNKGEYCIIIEVSGSANDIQYILCHDIANRNPMIYQSGMRRFLNLYDTSRYEVYYSDYVQSLTGLGSIFEGNKLELGIAQPTSGFRAEVARTNYGLYNIDGQIIYNADYYSEVTEVVHEPDWLTDNRLTGNQYMIAVFQVLDEASSYYNHYIGMSLYYWQNYLNAGKKIYVPKVTDDMYDPWAINNAFIWTDHVRLYFCDLGTTLEETDFSTNPYYWNADVPGRNGVSVGSTMYSMIGLENFVKDGSTPKTYNKLVLYNWDYGANMVYTGVAGTSPTPIVRPTAAPLASPTPIPSEDTGIFNLGNTIKRIFLPSPDIMYNEINASKDLLLEKLHIDLNAFNPELAGRPQNVTMEIYGQTVTLLDFEQIENLASQATIPLNIVRVFVYVFALWGLVIYIIDYFNNRGGAANA